MRTGAFWAAGVVVVGGWLGATAFSQPTPSATASRVLSASAPVERPCNPNFDTGDSIAGFTAATSLDSDVVEPTDGLYLDRVYSDATMVTVVYCMSAEDAGNMMGIDLVLDVDDWTLGPNARRQEFFADSLVWYEFFPPAPEGSIVTVRRDGEAVGRWQLGHDAQECQTVVTGAEEVRAVGCALQHALLEWTMPAGDGQEVPSWVLFEFVDRADGERISGSFTWASDPTPEGTVDVGLYVQWPQQGRAELTVTQVFPEGALAEEQIEPVEVELQRIES